MLHQQESIGKITLTKSLISIPDAHIRPGQNLRRWEALGNFILERQPNYVVQGGDLFEAEPLYGITSKKSWTPKSETVVSVEQELETGVKASELLWGPLNKQNAKLKAQKRKQIDIESHLCLGNHDARIQHFVRVNLEFFQERWGVDDPMNDVLNQEDYWTFVHEYQKPIEIEGVLFSHNYTSGTATASTLDTILKLTSQSAVGYHSHKGEWTWSQTTTGRPTPIVQSGWFFDPEEGTPNWVGPQGGRNWWNGFVVLNDLDGTGKFDPEFFNTERLIREYL